VKKFVIILWLAIIIKPVFPLLDYIYNYQYITTVLCENKDKPQLKCCGKCHLKKELAKASEGEKTNSSDKKDTSTQKVEVLYCENIASLVVNPIYFQCETNRIDNYLNFYVHLQSCSAFHPPTVV
jgi:hypothetical protein